MIAFTVPVDMGNPCQGATGADSAIPALSGTNGARPGPDSSARQTIRGAPPDEGAPRYRRPMRIGDQAAIASSAGDGRLSNTSSMMPKVLASSASMNLSRSIADSICSIVCLVYRA